MRGIVLLFLLCATSLLVTESNHITFSGFTAGTVYTYYTNGYNPITELTCTAAYTDPTVTSLFTSWYYAASTNTGSDLLRFEDIATVVKWGQNRMYFCRAVINEQEQEDSANIAVNIKYNTTIIVSYEDTYYIKEINNNNPVLIPVMTESVVISCDAEGGEWSYKPPTGARLYGVANPITIDLFTLENVSRFDCTKTDSTGSSRSIHNVATLAVGGGIWLQEEDTYTELSEADTVVLTEDRTLVCVSSKSSLYTAWHYRGDINTGAGERVHAESERSKGFIKLNIPKSLPANRTGYYYCISNVYSINLSDGQLKQYSIRISLPTDATIPVPSTNTMIEVMTALSNPTTGTSEKATETPTATTRAEETTTKEVITSIPISPQIFLHLYYTADYTRVFVGIDDVTVICTVKTDSLLILNVSLVDAETDSIIKSHSGSEEEIQLEQRVELKRGDLSYKCTVDTETGQTEERYVSIRAEDPYTQEIVNLRTDTSSDGREVLLQWDTSHTLLANETFIIWIYSVNETGGYRRTGATQSTEYALLGLSDSHHYSIRVQVVSRLSSFHTSLYYIHIERVPSDPRYGVIALIAVIFVPLLLLAGILVIIVWLLKRRNWRYVYREQASEGVTSPGERGHKSKEYIPISGIDNINVPCMADSMKSPAYKYEQMESVAPNHSEYYPLELVPSRKYYEIPGDVLISNELLPDKPETPLTSLKYNLDTLWENGMQKLALEFDQLHLNLMRHTQEHGKLEINRNLNVDHTILPYDTSRIVLQGGTENDYINASLIQGHITNRNFISTHFPTVATEVRFWRMVWEQRVSCVLLAATRDEVLGVLRLWPQSGSPREIGPLSVKFISAEEIGECIVCRCISISLCKNPSQVREVVLIEYSGWPVNEHSMLTIRLLNSVRTVREEARRKRDAPILVVCNTGSGRSGCVIAVYNLLDSISEGRESVSVFNCVNEMRNHRPYMVQTLNQYKIIHTTLLEIVFGNTDVKLCYATPEEDKIRSEFNELEYQCARAFQRTCLVARQYDMSGWPLPFDDTRVVMESPATSHLSYSYYNASYIRSVVSQTSQFIAAVSPGEDTVCQFLEIVFQQKCSLVIAVGKWNANKNARYWESKDETFDCLQLSCLSTNRRDGLVVSELKLKRVSTNKPHKFTHILYDTHSEELSSGRHESLLALLDIFLNSKTKPVLVHCEDGVGMSGVLLGAYYAVEKRADSRVDIFQACKLLRLHRQDMVPTLEQYQLCYDIVRQYLEIRLTQNYENLSSVS